MAMEYRTFPRGGERASVIGFGMGSVHEAGDDRRIEEALELALDAGVNFFDLAPSQAAPYAPYGRVLAPRRADVLTQMHLGAVYGADGQYGWSRDLDAVKRQFARVLDTLELATPTSASSIAWTRTRTSTPCWRTASGTTRSTSSGRA